MASSAESLATDGDFQDRFGEKLGELARLWRTNIHRRLRPTGLSFVQWSTLAHLKREGDGQVQKDLAAAMSIEGPSMVGILDRLVEAGLVERREASHDRRAKTVHLTEKAETVLGEANAEIHLVRARLLRGLSAEEIETCLRVFDRITRQA